MQSEVNIITITIILICLASALVSAIMLEQELAETFYYLFSGFTGFLVIYAMNDEFDERH